MDVLVFGASGMVGGGVLRACLDEPTVTRVVAVGRSPSGVRAPKLTDVVVPDVADLSASAAQLRGFDAAFFCLGVSSVGRSEEEYRKTTFDLTLAVARTLVGLNPTMVFTYVSGEGTDSTENGRVRWARVKGRTENALLALPFRGAYMFRPGAILPVHGVRPRSVGVRVGYLLLSPLLYLLLAAHAGGVTTTDRIGRAMIHVVQRGAASRIVDSRAINALARD